MAAGAQKKSAEETDHNWPGDYNGPPPPYPGMPQQGFGQSYHRYGFGQGYQAPKSQFGLNLPDASAQSIPSGIGLFDEPSEDRYFQEPLWQSMNPSS
jgi:hypothetical protein